VVAAGLHRHVERRAGQVAGPRRRGRGDRVDLGVRAAALLVPALPQDLLVADDERADHRVGVHASEAELGKLDRACEMVVIDRGQRGHNRSIGPLARSRPTGLR
jgi:hypothetical protein